MERLQRIARIWNWLPDFRAIAEVEHLGQAAEGLHLSPSALSRTLKLLEEDLGFPLFHRRGRGLQLNDEGKVLLGHVRDAMRFVDEALDRLDARDHLGVVRIGALGVAAHVHLPRLVSMLVGRHPHLASRISTPAAEDVASALLRGQLDLVACSTKVGDAGLTSISLAEVTNSVYCGPGHPLYEIDEPTIEQVQEHPFVAPEPNELGVTTEGWPEALPRTVASELDRMMAGVEACAGGQVLAVLPDVLAHQHAAGLRPIRAIEVGTIPVHVVRRRRLGERDRVDLVLDLMREVDEEIVRLSQR
ncbi:MAG: LysR family transcriptional regulator [Acidobacteriota bacterium]